MSDAFILKYRPQKVSELDSVDVRDGLAKILSSGKVPHAFLFTGPRGTGKTSAARIVAKAINCTNTKKGVWEPCNRCRACKTITGGTALDLIEIDAASTRGIDDIRNLREKVKLAPTQLKNKVYIIDEVHMLTTEAFNALLKTLEEPPAKTVFVLCTTDPEKLPPTIISRCTRFNFQKGGVEEVVGALKRVVRGEKLKADKEVLEEIAKSADGSFRDAQKILDQLAAGKKRITLKETKEALGKIEALSPKGLLSFLAQKELKKALLEIDRLVKAGADLVNYTQALLERLRRGLLVQLGVTDLEGPEEISELGMREIRFLLRSFSQASLQIKTNPIPQLPLELAAVEWCENKTGSGEGKGNNFSKSNSVGDRKPSQTTPASFDHSGNGGNGNLGEIESKWQELLASIRPMNHSVEALLRAARPSRIDGDFLILEVFYPFHKERLEEEKCRSIFEEAFNQFFQKPIKLKCILGEKKPVRKAVAAFSPPEPPTQDLSKGDSSDIIKTAEEIFGN